MQNFLVIEGLDRLGDPFLGIIARLGSDTEYTSSICQEATRFLFELCERERAHLHMADICMSLQNSLLARAASHATASALLHGKPHLKAPAFMQNSPAMRLRLEVDARLYSAQILDPAYAPFVLVRAGSLEDVIAYLYQQILIPGAAVKVAPAVAALPVVPDSAADLKARLAAIDALPKPMAETPDQYWAAHKAEEKKKLKDTWRNRDAVQSLEDGVEGVFDGGGGDRDPFAPLLDGLRAEMALYREFLNDQTNLWLQNKDTWGKAFPAPYGTPLGPKVDARYEFWPQRKEEWPLLFFCATQLLAGAKASTCSNERTHSVSGRICSKLRGSLLPSTVEQLTLAYYYIRREVVVLMNEWGKDAVANLEEEDLLVDSEECE